MNVDLMNGADLAYIGDAYYELCIRKYILAKGITKLVELHNSSVKYVSKTAQSKIMINLLEQLTDEERNIYRRGRNYKYKKNDNEYIIASGFEAVIGYLYLKEHFERLNFLIFEAIKIIEKA